MKTKWITFLTTASLCTFLLAACGASAPEGTEPTTAAQNEAAATNTPGTLTRVTPTAEAEAASEEEAYPGGEAAAEAPTPPTSEAYPGLEMAMGEDIPDDKLLEMMGEAVLIYQRSGGFAGVSEEWVVYPNGRIVDNKGNETLVESQQVDQLLADIEELGFFELAGSYIPADPCCDRFTYNLVVRQGNEVHRVTTVDDAPRAPESLDQILKRVSEVVNLNAPES